MEDYIQQVGNQRFHIPKINRILSQLNVAKDREESRNKPTNKQ